MSVEYVGTGWSYPLALTGAGGVQLATGREKIEQSMRLILSTYPSERVNRPDFGCRLRDFVFEGVNIETMSELKYEVLQALGRCEPRADVKDVVVSPDDSVDGKLRIDIHYIIRETYEEGNMVFPFYTIPDHGEEEPDGLADAQA